MKAFSVNPIRRIFLISLLLWGSAVTFSHAQQTTGKIIGTVKDQQGAVIPGVQVKVTNTQTQVTRDTITDNDGSYQVLALPIGRYRVTAEQPGFKKVVSEEEALEINQSLRIDLTMQIGETTEIIEVRAQAAGVETVNPTLGQSVTVRPLVNLPLNGCNIYDLALLMPGVTETNPGSPGLFSIAGARADSVTLLLDGGTNNNLLSNTVVFTPNPDAIEEFRILTSNYTAEYGRNAGGVVSVVTRSGTNQIHGSVFEFLRNDALNANSFFNNQKGLPREILKRNQFGFTLGGPLKKEKVFFFGSYQGQRQVAKQTTATVTVFTPAELKGDFSRSNSSRTGPDSAVVAFLKSNPFFQPNSSLAAQGIIDPGRINSVAQNYIKAGLLPTSPTGDLKSQGTAKNDRNEYTLKFDASLTERDKLAVTIGTSTNPTLDPFPSANVPGFPSLGNARRNFENLAYTKIFSHNVINEARFTFQRSNGLQAKPGRELPRPAELGIAVTPDNPTGPTRLSFDKGLTIGFSPQGPTRLVDNTFVYSDTLSWVRGNHSWKFGAYFSPYQNNTVYDFYVNGNFFFYGASGTTPGSGNDFADFLLGLPDEYLQFGEAPSDIRSKSVYGFVQDEWRVRKNLVLTLGIRYEYNQPKIDTRGRSFSLNPGSKSTVFTKAPAGLLFPGDPGAPKGANFADKNDWAPRFGFAWDPTGSGKTSIRGGFGVFYDILKGEDNLQFNGQAPFFGFSDLFFDEIPGSLSREVNYLTQPYVSNADQTPNSFPSRPPARDIDFAASGFLPFGGGGVYFVDPHLRTPYTYQYNLSIQHEVINNLTAELSYIGSSSHKLTSLVDANPFNLGTTRRRFNALPGNGNTSFSYLDEFRNVANANYNGMGFSLNKRNSDTRFLGTTYFIFAYTYGHSIDFASGFRQRNSRVPYYNARQFRASSDFDLRHRISFGGGWDLPFDRAWSSGPRLLTKGWSLYPIVTYRTGFPLDVLAGYSRSRTRPGPSGAGDGNLVRANLVGSSVGTFDPKPPQTFNNRTGNFWFSPANFTRTGWPSPTSLDPVSNAALRTYGSLPRNFFRGPGRTNVNLTVEKRTPVVAEKVDVIFRAEFFNLFNSVQFLNPSTNISSSQFGQITTTNDPRIIQLALKIGF